MSPTLRRAAAAVGRALRSSAGRRFAVLVLFVTGLVIVSLAAGPDRRELLRVGTLGGPFAPVVAVLGSAVLAAAVVPRTLLALVGGALFGWLPGSLYMLVGVTLGAGLAFGVGRLLGRSFVESRIGGRLAVLERWVSRRGIVAVLIARLVPMLPFAVANYAFGTTAIRPGSFVAGTALGAAPAMITYAALGSATARGDAAGATIAGAVALSLSVLGCIGTYLVWRNRPAVRKPA